MKKLRAVAFSLVMAFFQVLPAPVWAQGAAPPAAPPPPPPAPSPAPSQGQGGGQGNRMGPSWSGPSLSIDVCRPTVVASLPVTMTPPAQWRGKWVQMYADIRQDGTPSDVKLVASNGDAALVAAALDNVRQTWRWMPLVCGRSSSGQYVTVVIPRASCFVLTGFRPPPPLSLAQRRRGVNASVWVRVGQDGQLIESSIDNGSGDSALDAALLAHVRQAWRFYPLAEGCAPVRERFLVRFPEDDCIPKPVPESRTLPQVQRPAGPRAVDLQVVVGGDGKPLFTNVYQSSGDAALDEAAASHVKQAWRWEPITCGRVQPVLTDTLRPVNDMVRVAFP